MHSTLQEIHAAGAEADSSWRETIAAASTFSHLRTSGQRTTGATKAISQIRVAVPAATNAELERVCRGASFLTWTTLVAGTALYLSKYARIDSVALAAPPRKGSSGSVRHIFPVLLQVDHNITFREFLQSCRMQLTALYERPPARAEDLTAAGLSAPNSECPCQIGLAHADLHSSLAEEAADIRIIFDRNGGSAYVNVSFNSSLLSEQAVHGLLSGQFELLRQGLGRPDRYLSDLSVMSREEAGKLYRTQESQHQAKPKEDFLDLFERIASERPNDIAVRENDITVSYGELDRRADDFAQTLVARGIQEEEIVGVAMNRTATAIAAILGIWKAGAAYLPCDPNLPGKRLAQILDDSGTHIVFTDQELSPFPCKHPVTAIHVNQLIASQNSFSRGQRAQRPLERLAYVIYTSGSTGQPKGVLLSHRGLASLVHAQRQIFTDDECRNVLQFSAHSFDASIFDITMALGHGGTLHMSGDLQIPTGEPLFAVLRDQQITLATIPPCVVATLPADELPHLQTLLVAGEACPPSLSEQWSKRVRFVNAYGPTETTVWATFEQGTPGAAITIGIAIPGCVAYVLDEDLQPLPPGCPGELCLSGNSLARGFVGLPAMTAQRFVPNPLAMVPGDRIYRTGDLAVLGRDGRLEFLGRGDDQHKIRGYRIEIGDIEAALNQHPQIEQSVVIIKDAPGDSKTIVAYAVAKKDVQVAPSDVRKFVSERLPEYMVPSQLVVLEKMPLTRSGKIDKRSLLQADCSGQTENAGGIASPANGKEEVLARIWAELLKRERVGPEENFFQLGGHSLLAIQVVSRIKQIFGVHLPARVIFDAPTIGMLALRVDQAIHRSQATSVLEPEPEPGQCACAVAALKSQPNSGTAVEAVSPFAALN